MAGSVEMKMGKGIVKTSLGPMTIWANATHILRLEFGMKESDEMINPVIEEAKSQLIGYFEGRLKEFNLPLEPEGTEFQKSVWQELLKIPYGSTISYAELAIRLGDLKKIRAVGTANGKNPIAVIIPCHRVIGSDGKLVGYSSGLDKKEWLLKHEGAAIYNQIDMFG